MEHRRYDVEALARQFGASFEQIAHRLTTLQNPGDARVPFFVIRHGSDWVAFDSGNNGQCAVDPIGYWSKPVCGLVLPD